VTREAFVDARSLAGTVEGRGPRPGDRMRPLGGPGSRKLQDILVDLKIPAVRRALVPLVVCDGWVVWICGLVMAEEGRITADTTDIVRLGFSWIGTEERPDATGRRNETAQHEGDGQR
jgi:tRNA(Ile)-lysidine synthase